MNTLELYRPSVGMMLLNSENKVFLAKKTQNINTEYNFWQMPQGGIEEDENLEKAVARELYEETGVDINDVDIITKIDKEWICYDVPPEIAKKHWNGKYIGQKQKWFLLKAKNTLNINLNVENEAEPEFYTYIWADYDAIIELSATFRHNVYNKVSNTFKPFIK